MLSASGCDIGQYWRSAGGIMMEPGTPACHLCLKHWVLPRPNMKTGTNMKAFSLFACLQPSRPDSGASTSVPTLGACGNHPERYAKQMERHFGGDLTRLFAHLAQQPAEQQKAVIDGSEALRDFLGIRNPNRLGKGFLSSRASSSCIPDSEAPPALALAATRSGSDARVMRALARLEEILTKHPPGHHAGHVYQQRVEAAFCHLLRDFQALRTQAVQEKALELIERHLPHLDPGSLADIISLAREAAGRPGISNDINTRLHKVIHSDSKPMLGELLNMGGPAPTKGGDNRGKGTFAAMLKQSVFTRLAGKPTNRAESSANNIPSLSANKKKFIQQERHGASVHLSITEISKLAKAYSQKIGSPIHVSGNVIPITAEHRKAWLTEQERILDAVTSPQDRFFRMLHRYFPDFRNHQALREAFPDFGYMGQEHFHPENIKPESKIKLEKIINANTHGIRDSLLQCAWKERNELPAMCKQLGYGIQTGAEELAAIVKAVANNARGAAEGYIFFSSNSPNSSLGLSPLPTWGHVESYVVSSTGAVINVVPFGETYRHKRPNLDGQYHSDVMPFLPNVGHDVFPQGGMAECGTMGLSYLKQYLKDDARQLNENTLLLETTVRGRLVRFHLPSPQVLKYSQSNLYAKVVRAFVAGEQDYATADHYGQEVEVMTLQACLKAGATVSRPDGKEIPGGIEGFRKTWLELCDASDTKRLQMRMDGQNRYATYASQRLQRKANKLPE